MVEPGIRLRALPKEGEFIPPLETLKRQKNIKKMHRFLSILVAMLMVFPLFSQIKGIPAKAERAVPLNPASLEKVAPIRPGVPLAESLFSGGRQFKPIGNLPKPIKGAPSLQAYISPETGTPYLIRGTFAMAAGKDLQDNVEAYLEAARPVLQMDSPTSEFIFYKKETEATGNFQHLFLRQQYKGVRVYGAEARLHIKDGEIYLFNGRFFPTPAIENVEPTISKEEAGALVLADMATFTKVKELSPMEQQLIASEQVEAELVVYHFNKNKNSGRLAWQVTAVPNVTHRYAYFVDAKTGEILRSYSELCQLAHHLNSRHEVRHSSDFPIKDKIAEDCSTKTADCGLLPAGKAGKTVDLLDGPATAFADDLFGISRLLNTYQINNNFFLIDASRTMFNLAQSNLPDSPVGVIWTINALNTSPEDNNFQTAHLATSDNIWNDPLSVSAHYNGGVAYEYFKNTFGRESINGQGGKIISIINVVESGGDQMDNAFWNGEAMWYGNGNVAFDAPLAKAPDVAGHEMSHGVVQSTANLEYFGESGALNESFADVFGAMIDRDDWTIGEDVANSNIFPTGALRDMADPHNGGNGFNDNGYQPAHYSERFSGSQDNGGVHINSGIPNKAFQLFADAVGKDKAELVYYRALTKYLFRSAQFVDCRIAVVQAATDLYGSNEVVAAQNAFAAVGIGAGAPTDSQTDVSANPGDDYILMTDVGFDQLYIFRPDGSSVFNPLSTVSPLSRPSITDDGSAAVYIAEDNTMQVIFIDWQTGQTEQQTLQPEPIWRNVAVSKDGSHLSALTTDNDNLIWIYDFTLQTWQTFELYNPTTGSGQTTGNVEFADIMQWDFTGEWVMYDALNRINAGIEYWDINFVNVWDNDAGDFAGGAVSQLFSGLPDGVSVANPTFSKNSDYIVAFDYLDEFNNDFLLLATNIETGDVATVFENSDLSWPSYSTDDSRIVFEANDNNGDPVLAFAPLADDKISPEGNATVFIGDGRRGLWFADGERTLVDAGEVTENAGIEIFPNPVSDGLTLKWAPLERGRTTIEIFDLLGKKVQSDEFEIREGSAEKTIDLSGLPPGNYFARLRAGERMAAFKVLKL